MASYNSAASTAPRTTVFGAPVPTMDPAAPTGTFAPGTKIQVGSQKVIIQKYFSEGGFAHVYLVKMPKAIDGTDIAVLKRVAVPDKENLANMRTEVETMKKLKGHRPIVTYYDSHASQLKGGGYEVFLLMEFCNGGGLIDFMNTRLQNRLTEPEILIVFSDVAEGVACMHYLKPPLLHRDLKVENVLITTSGSSKRFKLCDFGSTAPPRPAATTATECRLIEDDVQKHTTLQYRSPEMIDVYRKLPIDEKSDIWALGVLLYKLCYYTTPFEAQGQLAILNASFKFPAYPVFSDKLKKLISSILQEDPRSRPNIYQVVREACLMQGINVPIKDIYAGRTQSESRRNQQLPNPNGDVLSPPIVGAVFSPPAPQQNAIPDVVPMRRGRQAVASQIANHTPKPSPSPIRVSTSDPFAALDGKSIPEPVDEISSRFPSLDQFSLLHQGGNFDFEASSPTKPSQRDLSQRVTEKLADDAFAVPAHKPKPSVSSSIPPSTSVSRAQKIISSNPDLRAAASPPVVYQPTPSRPANSSYVSQGTMTSPPQAASYRFPPSSSHHRSASVPRNQETGTQHLRPEENTSVYSNMSARSPQLGHIRNASSSRPSLETGRPSQDVLEPIARTKSSNARPRSPSTHLDCNIEYLREREKEKDAARRSSISDKRPSYFREITVEDNVSDEETSIASNVDFLRSMEEVDTAKKEKRHSSGTTKKEKRSSMPSISLAGTKNILAGRFGDAFKRFEHNSSAPPGLRTPSPLNDLERRELTPIAVSVATDDRTDDGQGELDMGNLNPEQRREQERRRLSIEERRVADAAAEYRKRIADRGVAGSAPRSIGGVSRATSIQNKVKSLLDENGQTSPTRKTAEGYGRFADNPQQPPSQQSANPYSKPSVLRRPLNSGVVHTRSLPIQKDINYAKSRVQPPPPSPTISSKTGGSRPSAPPKPTHLNSIHTGPQILPPKPNTLPSRPLQARPDMILQEREDYVATFSKRYPSLSGIELVERDIEK
ncbi:serine/threonine protein kinase-like protein [Calycina marina]|uniref:non-specific serine/threonine protein kinase n=1 Tax=Calycina marina TaxID=1763456 RepID=A0A9P7Z4J1_9HELO|nr:serine/threonine protein kinase-like protein [Calycina marina]